MVDVVFVTTPFTTAPEPNPEYEKNYELGIKYAKENDSDIIILTDPDADRVGAMYKVNNEYKQINGNLIGLEPAAIIA